MGITNQMLECCCSPACSLFCSLLSTFGIFTMVMLGLLIGSGYDNETSLELGQTGKKKGYVGDWTEQHMKADSKAQEAAAKNCYQVALIWSLFLGLSFVCCFANRSKPASAPRVRY